MNDLAARARELSKSKSLQYASDYTSDLLGECADALQAAQTTVGDLPEYRHTQFCLAKDGGAGPCSCYANEANAKRLAARKAVGLEG